MNWWLFVFGWLCGFAILPIACLIHEVWKEYRPVTVSEHEKELREIRFDILKIEAKLRGGKK